MGSVLAQWGAGSVIEFEALKYRGMDGLGDRKKDPFVLISASMGRIAVVVGLWGDRSACRACFDLEMSSIWAPGTARWGPRG